MNLPKRSEIKSKYYRLEVSESPMEHELNHQLLRLGMRGEKQYPVGPFFADIAFPDSKVAVEYDGKQHLDNKEYDKQRDEYFERLGWIVIRVSNVRLMNIDVLADVARDIAQEIFSRDREMIMDFVTDKKEFSFIDRDKGIQINGFRKIGS